MTNFYIGYSGGKPRIYRSGNINKIKSTTSGTDAFYSPDSAWSSVGFSGTGILSNKYLGSWTSQGTLSEISIYVTSTGKLHITADSISSDEFLLFSKTSVPNWLSFGDYNGITLYSFNFETSVDNTISAGNFIRISTPSN
jgi:hypothetical protein